MMGATIEASMAIKKLKEPFYDLIKVRDALRRAVQTDRMGSDPDFANYINSTLGLKLMPLLAREKSSDDEVSAACSGIIAWQKLTKKC